MGKATRWLKGLLGMKKVKDNVENSTTVANDKKEKKRWSFGKSTRDSGELGPIPVNFPAESPLPDTAWLNSYLSQAEKEQNKHAIAVAAATAAAADAAVAAAQAAVAVVRLTRQGKKIFFNDGGERWAALKIQSVFRGYLARKALRALKGLVKIQALVRGYLVRKRAAATLYSMQALIRAQTAARSQRARRSISKEYSFDLRKSIEQIDELRGEFHSKRLSAYHETPFNGYDESPKIVEIDTYRTRSRSKRITPSECEELFYQTVSSPLPCHVQGRFPVLDCRNSQDFEWCFTGDECRFSTAQSTPRFANSMFSNVPTTPAKSVCGESFLRPNPSYMANTQSFQAKLRSHSAPKQRPEVGHMKKVSLNEIMAARNSISGVRMHRPPLAPAQ